MSSADLRIAVIADYDQSFEPLPATQSALGHSVAAMNVRVDTVWVPSGNAAEFVGRAMAGVQGVIIGPGSPLRTPGGRAYCDHSGVLSVILGFMHAALRTASALA